MKYIFFTFIILVCSLSYGQVPMLEDKVILLVTNQKTCQTSRDAEQNFANSEVRQHLLNNKVQYVHCYGQNISKELHTKWKITHYPALVYFIKQNGKHEAVRTISGAKESAELGNLNKLMQLLNMRAKTIVEKPITPKVPRVAPPPSIQYAVPFQHGSS